MNLLLWSFHIRDIGVNGISSLNFSKDDPHHIDSLMDTLDAREAWCIATCNRVEYLFVLNKKTSLVPPFTSLKPSLTLVNIDNIIEHLLEVSCAVDSMVFGENQILGQMKASYDWALKNKVCGPKLSKLLNKILKETKQIRSETKLNSLNTSVSGVAGKLLIKELSKKNSILLVGASETNQLVAQTLLKRDFKNITITNRTNSKSKQWAKDLNLNYLSWSDFEGANFKTRAICFATSAKNILLNQSHIKLKPKMIVDLSMPSNTDAEMVKKYKIKYVNLEKIQSRLDIEKEHVEKLKMVVEAKIKLAKNHILQEIATLDLNHIIAQSLEKSKSIQNKLIENGIPEFENMTEDQKQALERWTQSLVNKLNHIHILTLKDYVTQTTNRNPQE